MHLWLTLNIVTTKLALSAGQDCLQIHVLGLLIVYEFRAPSLSSKTKKNNSIDSLPDEIGKQILQMLDIRPRAKSHNTILDSTVSLDCNYNILREKYGSF